MSAASADIAQQWRQSDGGLDVQRGEQRVLVGAMLGDGRTGGSTLVAGGGDATEARRSGGGISATAADQRQCQRQGEQ